MLKVRKKLGLTQAEIGSMLGMHFVTVSQFENGLCSLSPYRSTCLEILNSVEIPRDLNVSLLIASKGGAKAFVEIASLKELSEDYSSL